MSFFGRLGQFSWDSAKFRGKIHFLVNLGNVPYRRWEYWCSHLELSVGMWLWNVLHWACEVGAKPSSNLLSSWCLVMVLAWAAQEFHSSGAGRKQSVPCTPKKLWPQQMGGEEEEKDQNHPSTALPWLWVWFWRGWAGELQCFSILSSASERSSS